MPNHSFTSQLCFLAKDEMLVSRRCGDQGTNLLPSPSACCHARAQGAQKGAQSLPCIFAHLNPEAVTWGCKRKLFQVWSTFGTSFDTTHCRLSSEFHTVFPFLQLLRVLLSEAPSKKLTLLRLGPDSSVLIWNQGGFFLTHGAPLFLFGFPWLSVAAPHPYQEAWPGPDHSPLDVGPPLMHAGHAVTA